MNSRYRSSRPEVICKKGVLRNFAKHKGKHLHQSLFSNKAADLGPATLLKKKTVAQVFSCEYCEISKKTFSYRTPPVAAPEYSKERDYSVKSVSGQILKGEPHSDYIFLHLVLIGLKWDCITLFTKMNFISSKTHIYTRYTYGLLFTNMDIF